MPGNQNVNSECPALEILVTIEYQQRHIPGDQSVNSNCLAHQMSPLRFVPGNQNENSKCPNLRELISNIYMDGNEDFCSKKQF